MYYLIKFLHILSAAILTGSLFYSYYLWRSASKEAALPGLQKQLSIFFFPTIAFQLVTGFAIISLKKYAFSENMIIGSLAGFGLFFSSWLGFVYSPVFKALFLCFSLIGFLVLLFCMASLPYLH